MPMNHAFEPPKIVPLPPYFDTAGEQRVEALLDAVHGIAGKHRQMWLGHMFEHVDDALFDRAEKAGNNATRTQYFDGMRKVRKRRPTLERNLHATVNRELAVRSAPTPAATDSSEWQQIAAWRPSAWLEFQLPDEPTVRAQLSWISPMSGGHAYPLATDALFDRATSAIVSRLRQPDASGFDAA